MKIDIDQLVRVALKDVDRAVKGWLAGKPHDEVALLNRLTEVLSRRRRGCDVGDGRRVVARCSTYVLHREGQCQTDAYGSDLAVTLSMNGISSTKTALFQLKRCSDGQCRIEREQLCTALSNDLTSPRSYVVAVDDHDGSVRLQLAESLFSQGKKQVSSPTFETSKWESLDAWLRQWSLCEVGPVSEPGKGPTIEDLLHEHRIEADEELRFGELAERSFGFRPSLVWLVFRFSEKLPLRGGSEGGA